MIKTLVFVIISVTFQMTLEAALARLPPQEKPSKFENEEGCYVPELDKVLEFNKKYAPANGNCIQYLCQDNGETLLETCGARQAGEGCTKIAGDRSLSYPDCCDQVVCGTQTTTTTSPKAPCVEDEID